MHGLRVFLMKFNEDQMKRQSGYSFSLYALEELHKKGILTDSEMKKAEKIIEEKYKPILHFNS